MCVQLFVGKGLRSRVLKRHLQYTAWTNMSMRCKWGLAEWTDDMEAHPAGIPNSQTRKVDDLLGTHGSLSAWSTTCCTHQHIRTGCNVQAAPLKHTLYPRGSHGCACSARGSGSQTQIHGGRMPSPVLTAHEGRPARDVRQALLFCLPCLFCAEVEPQDSFPLWMFQSSADLPW